MMLELSPGSARLGARVRLALLGVVGLLLGHSAVYATRFGWGPSLDSAMSVLGHDGYWAAFSVIAIGAGAALLLTSSITVTGLQRRLSTIKIGAGPREPGSVRRYRAELAGLWPRLFLIVTASFLVQENIESWAATGGVPGIDVLLGHGWPTTLVILAAITFALAALGALVRWRIATLEARLALAIASGRPLPVSARLAPEWAEVHAAAPHRWTIDRRDAGRAPPTALPA